MAELDYSAVARVYAWLERLIFGSLLMRARLWCLGLLETQLEAGEENRVLLVGEGDGRFLEKLLECDKYFRVDYLDLSEGMMREARARVGEDARVRWHCGDVSELVESRGYAAVVLHFVLDHYEGGELAGVVAKISELVGEGGSVFVADFDETAHWKVRWVVRWMQVFFGWTARVDKVFVARADAYFLRNGLTLYEESSFWRGGVYMQQWKM
ncbi:class I SAM-dependent methyltransferase [Rubritalea tangerina]|uniref:Class I SAM-dependent methyltransferase n=1 Tax=Rubritalea tangerina TaxID=430798 RepID=A0ABW4ZC22_9BACT